MKDHKAKIETFISKSKFQEGKNKKSLSPLVRDEKLSTNSVNITRRNIDSLFAEDNNKIHGEVSFNNTNLNSLSDSHLMLNSLSLSFEHVKVCLFLFFPFDKWRGKKYSLKNTD